MKIEPIRTRDLDATMIAAWQRIRQQNPVFGNPFLSPYFAQAVGAVRDDVEVAILEEAGEFVGFFPFQRSKSNAGQPAGGPLSNAHAVILEAASAIDGRELLRACGLRSWKFHLASADQAAFQPYHHTVDENLYIDISQGMEAYEESRFAAGSKSYRAVLRKERKLDREMESVSFEFHTAASDVFDQLIAWKREQCHGKRAVDTFSVDWTVDLLRQILMSPTGELRAVLSVLYINDEPQAASYDLRERNIVDTWIPAYGTQYAKYSPGLVLLRKRCVEYAEQGVEKVYLGHPGLAWKDTFRSASERVASGSVDAGLVAQTVKRRVNQSIAWARNSPLRSPGRVAKRAIRRLLQHYELRQ